MEDNIGLNAMIAELWGKGVPAPHIAAKLGLSVNAVYKRKKRLSLDNRTGRHKSFIDDTEKSKWFIRNYPDMSNQTIAIYLGMTAEHLRKVARSLGLKKSEIYIKEMRKGELTRHPRVRDSKGKFIKQ